MAQRSYTPSGKKKHGLLRRVKAFLTKAWRWIKTRPDAILDAIGIWLTSLSNAGCLTVVVTVLCLWCAVFVGIVLTIFNLSHWLTPLGWIIGVILGIVIGVVVAASLFLFAVGKAEPIDEAWEI